MDIISSNPYRLLGVYSNSSVKDCIANTNKLKAYLKVKKSANFPTDLSNLMPVPVRTSESIEYANGHISLPQDQLKYALFWFINVTPIDEMAFAYLQKEDTEKAKELFGKKETFSSLINQGVLALIEDDKITAIQSITKVIHNTNYRMAFIAAVCDNTFQLSESDLAELLMNQLLMEIPTQELMQLFVDYGVSEEDNNYLRNKSISKPIAVINTEISKARNAKNDDANVQYQAGIVLMNETKESIEIIKSLLLVNDMQYQMTMDSLAKQILQCGINYYNHSNEVGSIGIDKAYKLQSYAYSIAVGKLTKDRCRENLEILDKKRKEHPPVAVQEYDTFIRTELIKYQALPNLITHAIDLIKVCTPYLMSIKDELGSTSPYYLHLSTLIVNAALYNVIEEFNSVSYDNLQFDLLIDRERAINKVKEVFKQAWMATLYMDKLDMEEEFELSRYSQNRASLKEQVSHIGIPTYYQSIQLEMRSDSQMFNNCNSVPTCRKYLELFPNGKFVAEVKVKLETCEFNACITTQDCSTFKKKYPNSKLPISRKWEDCYFNTCKTIENYEEYLKAYPNGRFIVSAASKIEEITFKQCKSIDDYKRYIQEYPSGEYKDGALQIIADEESWQKCILSNSKVDYQNYLDQFPNGCHQVEALQRAKPHMFSNNEEGWGSTLLSWGFMIAIIIIIIALALSD